MRIVSNVEHLINLLFVSDELQYYDIYDMDYDLLLYNEEPNLCHISNIDKFARILTNHEFINYPPEIIRIYGDTNAKYNIPHIFAQICEVIEIYNCNMPENVNYYGYMINLTYTDRSPPRILPCKVDTVDIDIDSWSNDVFADLASKVSCHTLINNRRIYDMIDMMIKHPMKIDTLRLSTSKFRFCLPIHKIMSLNPIEYEVIKLHPSMTMIELKLNL